MMYFSLAKFLFLFLSPIFQSLGAQGSVITPRDVHRGRVQTIYQFPKGTWVENLAARYNGQLLLTLISAPEIYLFDPLTKEPPLLLHRFPAALSVFGITEVAVDTFAVLVGNFSLSTGMSTPGSYSIWTLNLSGLCTESVTVSNGAVSPIVKKITSLPTAQFPNGMTRLSGKNSLVLFGDLIAGVIYSVDIATGRSKVVINDTFTAAAPTAGFGLAGVNGLHVRDSELYFTNTGQAIFARVLINEDDGTPRGDTEIVARVPEPTDYFDDFALQEGSGGAAYLVTGSGNSVEKVSKAGSRQRIVAGGLNSSVMVEPTAAAFGRGILDRNVLYVTTAGGLAAPLDGDVVVGGQVVAIDTEC